MSKPVQAKRILVSVTNDLVTDNRVRRLCSTLSEMGFRVEFIGRQLPESPPLPKENYRMSRMKLLFRKGAAFYAEYNTRLFFKLLFSRADVLVANDLDTLPANYLASKLKGCPLVYDSHELFTEVPELEHNAFAKKTWLWFERSIVPKLKYCITVNQSIADIFQKKYGVPFMVLRNMPYRFKPQAFKSREELGLPLNKKIIILQGSGINISRGAEEAVEAMKLLQIPAILLIAGNGDVIPLLKEKVKQENLSDLILFKDRMPYDELMQYTAASDLGISFDKPNNLNYLYSLPNKIFDYIQAGIPVLSSRLPEMERIINEYGVGDCIDHHDAQHIADKLKDCLTNEELIKDWKKNLTFAAENLCRENEEKELIRLYEQFGR